MRDTEPAATEHAQLSLLPNSFMVLMLYPLWEVPVWREVRKNTRTHEHAPPHKHICGAYIPHPTIPPHVSTHTNTYHTRSYMLHMYALVAHT